jgi:hypothetical protein
MLTSTPRAILLLLLLSLSAGCFSPAADEHGQTPSIATPVQAIQLTKVGQFRPQYFLPFTQTGDAKGMVGVADTVDRRTMFGHLDISSGTWITATSTVVGTPDRSFAAFDGQRTYVLSSLDTGVPPAVVTDVAVLAVFQDGKWSLEEAPARWISTRAQGLAQEAGSLYALFETPRGPVLWTGTGNQWSSEPVPIATGINNLSLTTNSTHVVILAIDTTGSVILATRPLSGGLFATRTIQPGANAFPGDGGLLVSTVTPSGSVLSAWWHLTSTQVGNFTPDVKTFVYNSEDAQPVRVVDEPTRYPWAIASTTNASFMLTAGNGGSQTDYNLWRLKSGQYAWEKCAPSTPYATPQLLADGNTVYLAYEILDMEGNWYRVPLSSQGPCLPEKLK